MLDGSDTLFTDVMEWMKKPQKAVAKQGCVKAAQGGLVDLELEKDRPLAGPMTLLEKGKGKAKRPFEYDGYVDRTLERLSTIWSRPDRSTGLAFPRADFFSSEPLDSCGALSASGRVSLDH